MIGNKDARWRRKMRIRRKIHGSAQRPRLSVFRSNTHIYAQLIDDDTGMTVAAVSTMTPGCREKTAGAGRKEAAKIVGGAIAELAKAKGIDKVVFDRNRYRFHGRVKELAEGARAGGLEF
ncbi:MAG: 50S ribosomal protein L18 [Candidatus Aureabacteria bacterium]|nr:50S ribosomal protein L18 [Candidatus Auribacterota bacterium]